MNSQLYNELVELFNVITDPLWDLYSSYNGYLDAPFLGAFLLGLIASTYPSQITYHLGSITYIANQMVNKSNWWVMVVSIFLGKLAEVYLIVSLSLLVEKDWLNTVLEGISNLSGVVYLLLGITFLNTAIRINVKVNQLTFFKGLWLSFLLSLFTDPGVNSILNLFTPWIPNKGFFMGWSIPFFYVFATFIPILSFSILSYGFKVDILLKKKLVKKRIHYFFGLVLIILALNQFFLYW